MICVFSPISFPATSNNGPPLLPGLMATSVWTNTPSGSRRALSLTMPVVAGPQMVRTFDYGNVMAVFPND